MKQQRGAACGSWIAAAVWGGFGWEQLVLFGGLQAPRKWRALLWTVCGVDSLLVLGFRESLTSRLLQVVQACRQGCVAAVLC